MAREEKASVWSSYTEADKEALEKLAAGYRDFLSTCKTERESVVEAVRQAKAAGYRDLCDVLQAGEKLKAGDKVYAVNMKKSIVLFQIGEDPLEKGLAILGAHIDTCRLDVKQNPLYEDGGLAYLDTHYYGGIKKYQWVTLPLALHGVVVKKDGTVVEIRIGEEEGDPVFCVTDLLIHLSQEQMKKNAAKVIEGEDLDILVGNYPLKDGEKESVKAGVLKLIEEQYGKKYDWSALFARAEHMNEQNRIELEKWELFKTPYSALCGIAESLYRLYAWASVNGQEDQFTYNDRKVLKIMLDAYQRRHQPFGGTTRHRAFLWGPSAVYYTDFPTWVQNCWGINIVLNMDSTMGHNMISTTDPDQAIKDLALFSEKATMRHHAVGGWDNVNAIWEWAKNFDCDMVLMNDNIACKGMLGVHAVMEEQARDLGFHFIFIEHDLEDCRTVSRQDMRNCVNNYMSVVLNEKPLDPTIVDFDDSQAY